MTNIEAIQLPELQGSEKQVKWAEDIRKNFVELTKKVEEWLENEPEMFEYEDNISEEEYYFIVETLLKEEVRATHWIGLRLFKDAVEASRFTKFNYTEIKNAVVEKFGEEVFEEEEF